MDQRIEADVQWTRVVRIELAPHPGVEHPEAIEADYQMKDGMLVLDMREPLVGYALRRWLVEFTADHALDQRSHYLYLNNPKKLYDVQSASLAPGYLTKD